MNTAYQLAEINVAKMKGVNTDDPIMKEFVDNLDVINELAERSPGFVWRLKDESNSATNLNPFDDEQVIVNMSVWEDVVSLKHYTFKTVHAGFVRRRKEWFEAYGKAYYALWWVRKGEMPTVEEAMNKLDLLQSKGASVDVFDFKNPFEPPQG